MSRFPVYAFLTAAALTGCSASTPELTADLTASYNVAAAAEAAYAAHPGANPKIVQQMQYLLAGAQAALFSYENSPSSGSATALKAAVAALIAYEAAQQAG